ncbi:hypothetical protein LNP18_06565 [Leuconostoc citreum]|uniref:hypothetical protein n=1 Tax=Leuconostoc citreum TaxID=33964 RepID=UPI00200A38CA|nr:hypothetical protein [Leuconostoc citreum]MCK8605767.1 hypothetical protein [Leuconostoc citreum]
MIATVNFFKWILDRFSWINKSWHKFSHWFVENQRKNLLRIFGFFVLVAVSSVILVSVVPRPSNLPSTPLNTPKTFGNLNKSATLTESKFNPKNGVLQLYYTINEGADTKNTCLDISQISFTAIADRGGKKVTAFYIPTSSNTMVVQFKNLNPKFNAVTITAHDKGINTAAVEAPSSYSSSSSSSLKNSNSVKANEGKFIVNRDKLSLSNELDFLNQSQLEIEEYHLKIANQRNVIKLNETAITEYQKGIEQQNDLIKGIEKQQANSTDDTLQNSIDNARNTITQIRSKISDAQNNISHSREQIQDYIKTISRVENGHTQLPKGKKI